MPPLHLGKNRRRDPTGEEEHMYAMMGATGNTGSVVAEKLLAREKRYVL